MTHTQIQTTHMPGTTSRTNLSLVSTPNSRAKVAGRGAGERGRERGEERDKGKRRPQEKLSFEDIGEIFETLDKNGDGSITHAEFIVGLKKNPWVAEKLGMPSHVRQEDGSRESYQLSFGKIDKDSSKSIEFAELCAFFGFSGSGALLSDASGHSPDLTSSSDDSYGRETSASPSFDCSVPAAAAAAELACLERTRGGGSERGAWRGVGEWRERAGEREGKRGSIPHIHGAVTRGHAEQESRSREVHKWVAQQGNGVRRQGGRVREGERAWVG